jgi:hypothetical protein
VGKETNFLLDPDLPEDDETQIEDAAAAPYFRHGFNPVLRTQYLAIPDIVELLDVASLDALKDILNGYAPSDHARRVSAHLRKGTRYDELTGTCAFDGFIREADMVERQAARLVDLARRSYRKMSVAGKAEKNPLFPTANVGRKPIVALADHFGLLPDSDCDASPFAQNHERFEENLAHDLLNPLLYHDKAAVILKQGFVRARSGQELRADDAIAMFENYLGIAQHKELAATLTKNLNAGLAERRAARRAQRFAAVMTFFYRLFRYLRKEAGPAFADEVLLEIFSRDNTRLAVKRYIADRKGRPDFERFTTDASAAQMLERTDRARALTRARVRRSRQQSRKPGDSTVQIGLGDGDGVKELNA